MIESLEDYNYYLESDRIALGFQRPTLKQRFPGLFCLDPIWSFQRLLRKCEYYHNTKHGLVVKVYTNLLKIRFRRLSLKLGFSIPLNVFGPGLAIVHYGTIVVNANAKVGANCRIHPSTCIGASGGESAAPVIGDNVYIGPGAKIYGDIVIGSNIAIAANAAVGKSFSENDIIIGGVPAIKVGKIEIHKIIKHLNHENSHTRQKGIFQ